MSNFALFGDGLPGLAPKQPFLSTFSINRGLFHHISALFWRFFAIFGLFRVEKQATETLQSPEKHCFFMYF